MKLLQILYPGLGGTSTVAFSIVDGLKKIKKLKIKNFFIFFGIEKLIKNNLQNCKKKRINFFFLLKSSFFKDIYKVYLRIKLINPDYIISHSNSFFSLLLFKLINNSKFYCVDHTPDKVRTFKGWVNLFLFAIFSDGMIYVSERNKKNLAFSILKLLNSKSEVILNGIDINKFQRKKKILDRRKIIIGMAGRFVNEKKQSLLIDAMIKYKKNFSDNNIEVSFAGSGYLLNSIKRKVREHNLSKLVKFKGNLKEKDLIKWFENIDIYFHLSDAETTSTAILQALSFSLPVFASNVEGNIQLSQYLGKKYIKLIKNEEKSLKKTIMYILNNKKYLKNVSSSMKKKISHKISLDTTSKKYLKFIKSY